MDAGNTQAFDACLREALAQTREWVPRWLGKLHSSLKDRELSASQLSEKQGMLQARTTLESHRDLIATRFLAALAESMENALPHTGSGSRRSPTVSFDELELMGDDQVQETVELARVQQIVGAAGYEQVMGDVSATLDWVSQQLWANSDKVGITGFCWGGKVVWQACARFAVLDAGVAWYGRLKGQATELQPKYPFDVVADIGAPVLGLYGGKDQGIPLDDVEAMRAALKA